MKCNYNNYIEVREVVNNRMSVAIHALSLIALTEQKELLTSDYIAGSVNTNPVVIRRITSSLSKAGLLRLGKGTKGMSLTREPHAITLLDVYKAVTPEHELFAIHKGSNIECRVGRSIETRLGEVYSGLSQKLEDELAAVTLEMIIDRI